MSRFCRLTLCSSLLWNVFTGKSRFEMLIVNGSVVRCVKNDALGGYCSGSLTVVGNVIFGGARHRTP